MSTKKEVTTVQENTKEPGKVENAQPTQPVQPTDPSQPSQPVDPGNSGSTPGLSFDTSDRVTGGTNW